MPIGDKIYMFSRLTIGENNPLGQKLIRGFLNNLAKQEVLPRLMFFTNEGALLCCNEDETLLEPLRILASKGVDLAICLTCLEYYNVDPKALPVGRVGTAPEFVELTTRYSVMTVT